MEVLAFGRAEVILERAQAARDFGETRFDSDHPAKDPEVDRGRAAHERIVGEIVVNAGLGDDSRAIADFGVIGKT